MTELSTAFEIFEEAVVLGIGRPSSSKAPKAVRVCVEASRQRITTNPRFAPIV